MDPRLCILTDMSPMVLGMPSSVVWVIIAILLIISGIYSASENAYTNCNKYHFKNLASKGNFTAKLIVRLIEHFDNTLITVLVGNNIIQTFMSFLSAILFFNMSVAYGWSDGLEAVLSTVVMAALVYIVSDTCPKILSKTIPNQMAKILAYPVTITNIILYPVILLFKGVLSLVHKIFKIKDDSLLTKEDLIHIASVTIDEDEQTKLFENDEKELLLNAFDFGVKKVKDVFIPLHEVFEINYENLTVDELNKQLIDVPFSRIPIYDGSKDNIIGILVLKTYFEEYIADKHLDIRSILEDVVKIDTEMNVDDAFRLLNKEKVHLGMVYENQTLVGVVSMEDILEILVDDIDEEKFDKEDDDE